jgi:hypothetical protein
MKNPRHWAIVAIAVVLAGGAFLYAQRTQKGQADVADFAACAAAGNPVMESHPRQCRTPDGRHFTEDLPGDGPMEELPFDEPPPGEPEPAEPICEDRCGDGTCAEVVCMGSGCPCVETTDSCPQDCVARP